MREMLQESCAIFTEKEFFTDGNLVNALECVMAVQGRWFLHHKKSALNLLMHNSNIGPNLHHFRDIVR